MKLLLVLCLVAAAVAAPAPPTYNNNNVELVQSENNNNGDGAYRYSYELTDGTKQEQQGELRNAGAENQYLAVKGFYTWIAPNGVRYVVIYTADEDGYQAEVEEGPGAIPPGLTASLLGG